MYERKIYDLYFYRNNINMSLGNLFINKTSDIYKT